MIESIIKLPVFGISLKLHTDDEGETRGSITSDLHERENDLVLDTDYNVGVDALESFILACACAGVNVESIEFVYAIETTVESLSNNL